jgi:amidohydrolase
LELGDARRNELFGFVRAKRQLLHRFPDLSGEEAPTLELIRRELLEMGYGEASLRVGEGLVLSIRGTKPGPRLVLRSPVDALPIVERTGLAFSSDVPGRMHACGHDATSAVLLGMARAMLQVQGDFAGELVLFFQGGEETLSGARRALETDLLRLDKGDFLASFHLSPRLEVGQIGFPAQGLLFAGAACVRLKLSSRGGHVANASSTGNLIAELCPLLSKIESLAKVQERSAEGFSFSWGKLAAGTAWNVLPQAAEATGSLRYRDDAQVEAFRRAALEALRDVHVPQGSAVVEVDVLTEPLVISSSANALLTDALRPEHYQGVVAVTPSLAAEDAAVLFARAPGVYFLVGCSSSAQQKALHADDFDFAPETTDFALLACVDVCERFFSAGGVHVA